jgi:hypothetical protein
VEILKTSNGCFSKFTRDYKIYIDALFNIVKSIKDTDQYKLIDSYEFTIQNPPPRPCCKYTDKLYVACILYILIKQATWTNFNGPIPGKQVHKRRVEYSKIYVYQQYYESILKEYLDNARPKANKYLSADSTTISNQYCSEVSKHNPRNKNRKGVNISTVINDDNVPIILSCHDSTYHDVNSLTDDLSNIKNNPTLMNNIPVNNDKIYILADSAYDSKNLKTKIREMKMIPIVPPNKRNTKNPNKLKGKILTRNEKHIYRKRIHVEHFFRTLKKNIKLSHVYEKTIKSFHGLCLLAASNHILNIIQQKRNNRKCAPKRK